jgi:Ser/Thr protein kinase RdoA (MazF antagonist)
LFFTRVWVPSASAETVLAKRFETLGTLLAELHAAALVAPDAIDATTTPFRTLRRLLDRSGEHDRTTRALASWLDIHERPDTGDTFIHGNFRFDNVLDVGGRLAFIDFENCGRGSFYQDLSRPISELLLTRCAMVFPVGRALRCAREFLQAYASRLSYEAGGLNDFVTARLGRYWLETRDEGISRRRIGGIPVSRSRVEALMLRATSGEPLW